MIQHSEYNHSQFAADLANSTYKGALYCYTIDAEAENDVWILSINSTSLSELDEDKEGELECYNYPTREEAQQDINTANKNSNIDFEPM